MRTVAGRAGTTLAEAVVGLALTVILLGAASRGLTQHLRLSRARESADQAAATVQLVRDVLRAALAHADRNVRVLGDTAVQLSLVRVAAVACDAGGNRVVLPAGAAEWSTPRSGDSVAIADTSVGAEWRGLVASVRTERTSAVCPAGGTRVVTVSSPPASALSRLLPTRVWRVVRYVLYRASDGTWWLGERSCAPGCTTAQPIAGPLRSPSLGGLHLTVVSGADGSPLALDVSVQATSVGGPVSLAARLPVAP